MASVIANGIALEYEWYGDRRNPVVLGIVGFSDQLTSWPAAIVGTIVDSGYSFLAFDSRDMGLSTHFGAAGHPDVARVLRGDDSFALPYTLRDMAQDTIALMDALHIERGHLIGYSMGGAVAQLAAIAAPGKVASVATIFSTSYAPDLPKRNEAVRSLMLKCCAPGTPKAAWIGATTELLQAIAGRVHGVDETLRADVTRLADRAFDPGGTARHVLAIADYGRAPALAELRDLKMPFLVLQSDDDPLFSLAHGEDLCRRIPDATLVVIEGAGHLLGSSVAPVIGRAALAHLDACENRA